MKSSSRQDEDTLCQDEDQEEATPRQERDRHSQELVGESEL